jgi:hypothetical protein
LDLRASLAKCDFVTTGSLLTFNVFFILGSAVDETEKELTEFDTFSVLDYVESERVIFVGFDENVIVLFFS